MKEEAEKLIGIKSRITDAILALKLAGKEQELEMLEAEQTSPKFWDDAENARKVNQKIDGLKKIIEPWRKMEQTATDLLELLETSKEADSILGDIQKNTLDLESKLAERENETYLSGKYDGFPAILSIYAGAGGVDAQDWSEMLLAMFLKYCQRKNFIATVVSKTEGNEAGIKSATVEIEGPFAYGLLKSERGVHRLVRISPYDADKARHTSFALVEVIPEIEDLDSKIPESEIRVDTYRASGHGGQGVNTTDSAVRLTHIPTGITVSVQNERSQLQNKATALKILNARVQTLRDSDRDKELKIIRGENMANEWGSQIRSYVIHPYQMVKDHRTGVETSDTQGVLNGDLNQFVEAYLKNRPQS